jgi:hypothetical protein
MTEPSVTATDMETLEEEMDEIPLATKFRNLHVVEA